MDMDMSTAAVVKKILAIVMSYLRSQLVSWRTRLACSLLCGVTCFLLPLAVDLLVQIGLKI